jgi:hypothetical protein
VKGSSLYGRLLALTTNIRLGLKGLLGTNTLAYYEHSLIMDAKCFITFGQGDFICIIKILSKYWLREQWGKKTFFFLAEAPVK